MRHAGGAPNAAALEAQAGAVRAASLPKRKSSARTVADGRFLQALDDVSKMLREGRWEEAEGLHFAALYADLHFRVYGAAATDLGPKERTYAARLADNMLEKDFAGNRRAFAMFVSWSWSREKGREEWRRTQNKSGGRISWRDQFGRRLLAEFRVEEARKAAKR